MTPVLERHPDARGAGRSRPAGRRPAASAHHIGEVARRVGVSASALRLWERQGLVRPARSGSGYRLYSDEDLTRLRRIRRMRDERVNAPGIRRILTGATGDRGASPTGVDGGRLRMLRRQRGLSLREAARLSGVSISFLSGVERNSSGASLASLQRLTHTYGITVLELFARPTVAAGRSRDGGRRVRPNERPVLALESGVRIEQLAVGAVQLEPQLFVLAPAATSDGDYAHEGEEFLYVLEGALTVWVGERERYRLAAGDALSFPSTLPHRWRNRADGETRLLWINTPPTF